jgi:transposase
MTGPPWSRRSSRRAPPEADIEHLAPIQEELAPKALTPAQHLVDAGYVRGRTLVTSRKQHGIALIGPLAEDHQ